MTFSDPDPDLTTFHLSHNNTTDAKRSRVSLKVHRKQAFFFFFKSSETLYNQMLELKRNSAVRINTLKSRICKQRIKSTQPTEGSAAERMGHTR